MSSSVRKNTRGLQFPLLAMLCILIGLTALAVFGLLPSVFVLGVFSLFSVIVLVFIFRAPGDTIFALLADFALVVGTNLCLVGYLTTPLPGLPLLLALFIVLQFASRKLYTQTA